MLFLNVSFGLFAFLPEGWLFMAFVITMEAFIMSFFLSRKKFEKRISIAATTSNIISGIIGIMASLLLNGGWWLVVWFPWVSSHEVNVHNSTELTGLLIYTPVRDKIRAQTAQVVLIFRHAQEGHPACSRRSNMQ